MSFEDFEEEGVSVGASLWKDPIWTAHQGLDKNSGEAVSLLWPAGRSCVDPTDLDRYVESVPCVEGVLRYSRVVRNRHGQEVLVAEPLPTGVRVLPDLLESRRLTKEECAWLASEVLQVVERCHDIGYALAQLRPRRFLVVPGQTWTVRIIPRDPPRGSPNDAKLTRPDDRLGLLYLAPEQIAWSDDTPASDVYSVAAVLHHAVAGWPPFRPSSKGFSATLKKIQAGYSRQQEVPLRWSVPSRWREALSLGLHVNPTERPSARGLLELLAGGPAAL